MSTDIDTFAKKHPLLALIAVAVTFLWLIPYALAFIVAAIMCGVPCAVSATAEAILMDLQTWLAFFTS